MQWSTQDLLFRLPSNAIIRQAADGKIEIPQNGTLHAVYENQIYRIPARKEGEGRETGSDSANRCRMPGVQASESRHGAPAGRQTRMPAWPPISRHERHNATAAR